MGVQEEKEDKSDFLEEVTFNEKEHRYEVKLPWKAGCSPKSSGYSMCVKRLHQLRMRLKDYRSLLEEYDRIFNEQETMGIVEPVGITDESSCFLPPPCSSPPRQRNFQSPSSFCWVSKILER